MCRTGDVKRKERLIRIVPAKEPGTQRLIFKHVILIEQDIIILYILIIKAHMLLIAHSGMHDIAVVEHGSIVMEGFRRISRITEQVRHAFAKIIGAV